MSITIEQIVVESNGQQTKDPLRSFIDYWTSPPRGVQDDARKLYDRYVAVQSALADHRRRTVGYLVPANHGKGWHPVFDPDLTEEVTALASEIERHKADQKSIVEAIEAFMSIAGGPSLQALADELQSERRRLQSYVHVTKAATIKASNLNPRLSPAEVQELPAVVEANGKLSEARLELEPKIEALSSRLEKARAILGGIA
jgi:hypothetical protein